MFEIKNAFKNVKRNKKRYVLVAILIFIISFISVIALIVNDSAQMTVDYYLNEYGSEATIDIDPEQMRQDFEKGETTGSEGLSYEDYEQIATSEYVTDVSYEQITFITSDEVEPVESDMSVVVNAKDPMSESGESQGSSFNLIGSDSLENSSYFADDMYVIVDGDYPQNENEILIDSELASNNSLEVGDSAVFMDSTGEEEVSLKIVGIYESVSQDTMSMTNQNMLFTTYDTIANFTDDKSQITATYTLTSYKDVEVFEQQLYDNGLDESYYVNNNQELLNQIIGPVESTMSLLNNVMVVVFIIGGAILIFINLLILRERKYEIGVLRALGQKKSSVIYGLMLEMLIVAIIAMVISILSGIVLAQPISDALIASSNSTETATQMTQGGHGGGMSITIGGPVVSESVESITTTINVKVLALTLGINMLLILITTFVSGRFITRQQPNEILRER